MNSRDALTCSASPVPSRFPTTQSTPAKRSFTGFHTIYLKGANPGYPAHSSGVTSEIWSSKVDGSVVGYLQVKSRQT